MTQKLLSNLDVHSHAAEIRSKAMPEAVPSDDLPRDPSLHQGRANDLLQHHVRRQRLLTVQPFRREDEVGIVREDPMPSDVEITTFRSN